MHWFTGSNRPNYEDAKSVEASAVDDGSAESVVDAVQAEGAGDQEVHRHSHRKGIPGKARRCKGHVQLSCLRRKSDLLQYKKRVVLKPGKRWEDKWNFFMTGNKI